MREVGAAQAVVVIVGFLAVIGWITCTTKKENQAVRIGRSAEPGEAIEWLTQTRNWCSHYDSAPNEVKKSEIYRNGMEWARGATLKDVRGKLTRIATNQGGSELFVSVEINASGKTATFSTESLSEPIRRGSQVYKAVAELREGACVVVSASRIEPNSVLERSQLCDNDYFARFTKIAACR